MITLRPADERFETRTDWLASHHTFSFGAHHDPRHMGFRALRVINDDVVAPGQGFGPHPHRDMEIVTYVVSGELAHRDSMGNGSVIRPGELQRMSAGTGVVHSELNPSPVEPVHFLQIWLEPSVRGLEPGYEQRAFPLDRRRGRLRLLASRDGRDDSLTVHQDVSLYAAFLDANDRVEHVCAPGRHAWIHVVRGSVDAGGARLAQGDGAAVSDAARIEIVAREEAEVLLFDLA